MLPVLIGLLAASLFGIAATVILGPEALLQHAWVDVVFWAMIAAGAATSAVNIAWECIPCRLARQARKPLLAERLCQGTPCA